MSRSGRKLREGAGTNVTRIYYIHAKLSNNNSLITKREKSFASARPVTARKVSEE